MKNKISIKKVQIFFVILILFLYLKLQIGIKVYLKKQLFDIKHV